MDPEQTRRDYWEDRLAAHPGIEGVGYLGLGRAYNDWLYRLRAKIFRRIVRRYGIGTGSRVLDIGSGTGFYLDLWQACGVRDLVGSDLTDVAVERLRTRFSDVRQLDITEPLPSDLGAFDVVSAFDVLFHITDDASYRRAIASIASVLRPGGVFLLSENFLHGPAERSPHQVSRSLQEIGGILDDAGFDVVERRPMMVVMNAPTDPGRLWTRKVWTLLTAPARIHDVFGSIVGAVLFAVDLALTAVLKESPTTEYCVCRKRS